MSVDLQDESASKSESLELLLAYSWLIFVALPLLAFLSIFLFPQFPLKLGLLMKPHDLAQRYYFD